MGDIDARIPDSIDNFKFKVVRKSKMVVCPELMLRQLRAYEELLSSSSGSLPYRPPIQLNSITEVLVVLNGKKEVSQDKIDVIAELSNWINYDFKEL